MTETPFSNMTHGHFTNRPCQNCRDKDKRIEELEEAYATYRHAAQSAFEPGCDCATCALVRGEALAELEDGL